MSLVGISFQLDLVVHRPACASIAVQESMTWKKFWRAVGMLLSAACRELCSRVRSFEKYMMKVEGHIFCLSQTGWDCWEKNAEQLLLSSPTT